MTGGDTFVPLSTFLVISLQNSIAFMNIHVTQELLMSNLIRIAKNEQVAVHFRTMAMVT